VLVVAVALLALIRVVRGCTLATTLACAWIAAGLLDVVWEGGDWMPAYRFLVPLVPLATVMLCVGIGRMRVAVSRRPQTLRTVAVLTACCAGIAASSVAQARTVQGQVDWLRPITTAHTIAPGGAYLVAARWVSAHAAPGSLVAIEEAGLIPYFNENVQFLDLFGLTDTHLARAPGEPPFGKTDDAYVLSRAPDYAVLWANLDSAGTITWAPHAELMQNSAFRAHYHVVETMPRDSGSVFLIFARS